MAELVRMKLADAARHAGVSVDTVRRAIRRKTIDAQRDNSGAWFVLMPADTDAATLMLRRRSAAYAEPEPTQNAAERTGGEVQALKDHNETLKAQLAEMRQERERAEMRLIEERTRFQDELQEARSEADHAKADQVRMAQDVAGMFDELRTLADRHAELHADRARLEAELERELQDADRQRGDHATELDRARQDAGLWREEADRERARIANMQADAEHTEREMARLRAELEQAEQARRRWWHRWLKR